MIQHNRKFTLTIVPSKGDTAPNEYGSFSLAEIPDHKLADAISAAFRLGSGVGSVEVRRVDPSVGPEK